METAILQAVANTGFPIVMCLVLMKYVQSRDEKHSSEIDKMATALNNNTIAINQLISTIERSKDE